MIDLNDEFLEATADRDPQTALSVLSEFRQNHEADTDHADNFVHIVAFIRVKGGDRRFYVHHTTEPTTDANAAVVARAWGLVLASRDPITFRAWRTPEVGTEDAGYVTVDPGNLESVFTTRVAVQRPNQDDERRAAGFHPPVTTKQQ